MPITASEITFYEASAMAASENASVYGGAISSTEVSASLNAVFFPQSAEESGGASVFQHQKIFLKNEDGSITFTSVSLWIGSQEHPWQETEGGSVAIPQVTFALEKASAAGSAILDGTNAGSSPLTLPPFMASADFTAPASAGVGLAPPSEQIAAGSRQGIWLRRELVPGVVADISASARINVRGYTT